MAPFYALTGSFVLLRLAGWLGWEAMNDWIHPLRIAVALMFLLAATAHWGKRRPDLIRMVPASLPRPDWIISATGWLEVIGAAAIVLPATARAASLCLACMLLMMFPANIRAARNGLTLAGKPATPLLLRTVLQIVFLAAVLTAGYPVS
ncbi:hypothetical protein SK3146_06871 [Paenibacillus konkukensis]|uniref:DoxX family protein n=1 Tax=Paenibacillus konkukensis TaxID=2020716 RepID=A0ABY4S333_9BACL|nr:DoxX family membrane protein [Paenibacillus konkukensis]UQZ87569.1 hypothetical protein SK3146_06871 [Paenibacillus konkukensis]